MEKSTGIPAAFVLAAVRELRAEGFADLKQGVVRARAERRFANPQTVDEYTAWVQANIPDVKPGYAAIAGVQVTFEHHMLGRMPTVEEARARIEAKGYLRGGS